MALIDIQRAFHQKKWEGLRLHTLPICDSSLPLVLILIFFEASERLHLLVLLPFLFVQE